MPLVLRIAMIIITLIFLFIILKNIKRKKLNITFSLFWLIIGAVLIIATILPHFIETVSTMIGFEKPSNMIFCTAIFVAFYSIFSLTVIVSKEYKKNIVLIQELSLLKKKVAELEEEKNGK
jgi:hypothetical protein